MNFSLALPESGSFDFSPVNLQNFGVVERSEPEVGVNGKPVANTVGHPLQAFGVCLGWLGLFGLFERTRPHQSSYAIQIIITLLTLVHSHSVAMIKRSHSKRLIQFIRLLGFGTACCSCSQSEGLLLRFGSPAPKQFQLFAVGRSDRGFGFGLRLFAHIINLIHSVWHHFTIISSLWYDSWRCSPLSMWSCSSPHGSIRTA